MNEGPNESNTKQYLFFSRTVGGGYAEWSKWSECSVSCGGGFTKRSRTCTKPAPKYGGTDCSKLGPDVETQKCNLMQCASENLYFVCVCFFSGRPRSISFGLIAFARSCLRVCFSCCDVLSLYLLFPKLFFCCKKML